MGTTSRCIVGSHLWVLRCPLIWAVPVNKAAYVIGTGALATGEYGIMVAVMAGGMVPLRWQSLFCTTFFPSRFPEAERKSRYYKLYYGPSLHHRRCHPICSG